MNLYKSAQYGVAVRLAERAINANLQQAMLIVDKLNYLFIKIFY
jgi:hypothetical protein